MGIVKFRKFIDKFKGVKFKGKLENISSLFIDCNGIFHKGKGEIYKLTRDHKGAYIYPDSEREKISKMDPKVLEKKHINFIIDEFQTILEKFKPSSTLILAPDGMAPAAKMQQQKERRYGNNSEEDKLFMGAAISPGTDFMFNLDREIKKWLSLENKFFPKKVIYSSHLCPGEGEHKIFDFIRNHEIETARANHVIYGADGDLFIISLFSPLKNIFLFNENCEEYYNINKLKNLITKELDYKENLKHENFTKLNPQLIRDFCFLTFMVGNDFIRKMPNLYDTKTSLKILIDVYKENKKNLTNFKHQIIWSNFLSFLKILRDYKYNNIPLYQLCTFSSLTPYHTDGWIPYPELRESYKIYNDKKEEEKSLNKVTNLDKFTFILDKQILAKLWYDKQFKPRNVDFREQYENGKYYSKKDVSEMCNNYLKILQWSLHYYNRGDKEINKMFFYPYFYTPLLESLIHFLEYKLSVKDYSFQKNILVTRNNYLTPVHQLMLILPPSNKVLIPSPFREIYTEKLASISPLEYQTLERQGTEADYVRIKLIPFIDPFLVVSVLKNIEIPDQYKYYNVFIKKIN